MSAVTIENINSTHKELSLLTEVPTISIDGINEMVSIYNTLVQDLPLTNGERKWMIKSIKELLT